MNIQPIRIYNEEEDEAPIREPQQDDEINLPEPPKITKCEGYEIEEDEGGDDGENDLNIEDFNPNEEKGAEIKKKNSLFGDFDKVAGGESKFPFIYVAMALGLIKFAY